MRYLLLIHSDEKTWDAMTKAEQDAVMDGHMAMQERMKKVGAFLAADRLCPVATATTIRVRDGKVMITDGPFAESKEQFGGFYMIEAANLDEALKWAAEIPCAQTGSVEVRPIWEDDEAPKANAAKSHS